MVEEREFVGAKSTQGLMPCIRLCNEDHAPTESILFTYALAKCING